MDVSVIIVSYNASSYLKECLDSIFSFTKNTSFEIIVVDNASTDDSVAVAKSYGSKITLVVSKDNRGFGAGVNVGLKKACLPVGRATGKYILILNPDIRFLEDSISKMKAYMESHLDVGLVGCTLLDSENKMLPNGGYFPTLTRLFFWAFFLDDLPIISNLVKQYHPHTSSFWPQSRIVNKGDAGVAQHDEEPDWVTGGFMFVRNEVVDKVEGLDENIFMYGEEVEWQYRIRSAGYKIGYTPSTKVIHHERKSAEGSPRGAVLGEFKGLKYIYGKYFPGWKQIALGSLLDMAAVLRVIFWLVRRNREMVKIYLEALAL